MTELPECLEPEIDHAAAVEHEGLAKQCDALERKIGAADPDCKMTQERAAKLQLLRGQYANAVGIDPATRVNVPKARP